VGVIEKKQTSIGGELCINTGTIPSKDDARGGAASLRLSTIRISTGSNHNGKRKPDHGGPELSRPARGWRAKSEVTQNQLKRNGGGSHPWDRQLSGMPITVRVENNNSFGEYEADYVVIATGTKAVRKFQGAHQRAETSLTATRF